MPRRLLALLALLTLALPGARPSAGRTPAPKPIVVTDDTGAKVRLKRPAQRIVVLSPSGAECLFHVGAGQQIVGVVQQVDFPAAAAKLPRVGSFSNPDVERIFALRPDLIVSTFGNPKPLADRLRRRKVAVYTQNPSTVDGVLKNLRDLGKLTGRSAEASRRVRRLQVRLDRVARKVKGRKGVRSLVLLSERPPLYVAGKASHIHDALRIAGGDNVAGDLANPYPTLSAEKLIVSKPQVIFLPDATADRIRFAKTRPGIRATPAAKQNRILTIPGDWLQRPGPRLVDAIERMARALHPEAYR